MYKRQLLLFLVFSSYFKGFFVYFLKLRLPVLSQKQKEGDGRTKAQLPAASVKPQTPQSSTVSPVSRTQSVPAADTSRWTRVDGKLLLVLLQLLLVILTCV